MKRPFLMTFIMMVTAFWTAPLFAQQATSDKLTVPWSDPARPGLLKVNVHQGGINVKTHAGKDVIIEAKSTRTDPAQTPAESGGLRRIDLNATGLVVEEENNVMSVSVSYVSTRTVHFDIQVPAKTNLTLSAFRGGDIVVEGVEGEIEATSNNGSVTLNNVAGSVVANSMRGKVAVSLRQVMPDKPMAFTSMNGTIDITLPAATKADLNMRSDQGEIYSDFDVQIRPTASQPAAQNPQKGGRYRIEIDKVIVGTINGGGPKFDMRTFRGNIYIRKGK